MTSELQLENRSKKLKTNIYITFFGNPVVNNCITYLSLINSCN